MKENFFNIWNEWIMEQFFPRWIVRLIWLLERPLAHYWPYPLTDNWPIFEVGLSGLGNSKDNTAVIASVREDKMAWTVWSVDKSGIDPSAGFMDHLQF